MSSNDTKKLIQEITDDFVTLAEENAIKVRFVETQAHHRPRDDIFVVYEICNGFRPSSRDWIGLYSAARNGVNDYLNFQWAPRHPRDQKFPNIRGVLFPAGEVDISSSTTDKYMFMYISKANQILAESQKFYISDVDPESDLDLICVEDNEDLEDFTLIQSTPEREQGNFEVVKDWNSEEPGTSDPTSPSRKYSDHVTLTSDAANGRTLLEIFSDTADDKAVVPYTGSGPVVLYTPKNQGLPANIVQMVKEIEEMKKPRGIFTVPFVRELTKEESKDNKEKDVDLEALQVELEYVDNNLNQQRNLVKELTSKVKNLGIENKNLNVTNEKLYRNLRNLTNDKESVESELSKCRCKIEELRTIVRLQKKGNRTLEEECRKAQEEVKKSKYQAERLISNMNLLEQEKSELEENLAQHLDINGNVKEEETVPTNEPDVDNDNEGWTVATSRKTDRKQRLIEKLEKNLVQEKEKCEQLEGKLKDCQQQIEKLQSDVRDHQREEQKLVEQICEEKNCSNELNSRVKELTAEMEKMKLDNDRLTQEVALVKRQKMRTKRHLVEREEELITRIRSLEDALKASKLINKKAQRQCETFSQTFFQTSNTNTQTPKIQTEERGSLTDKICGPRQDLCTTPKKKSRAAENNEKKTQSWDDYFESFATSWWKENVNKITSSSAKKPQQESLSTPAQTSTVKQQKESPSTSAHGSTTRQQKESPTTSAHGSQRIFNFHDPLFPFPIFPLADNEELPPNQGQVEEPVDLTMIRTVGDESACPSPSSPSPVTSDSETSTSSSDSSTSSWNKQVDEEAEELIPLMGGGRYGIRDVDEIDPRERKKAGARKTAAYIVSKQPKPQSQERREDKAESSSEKSSKKSGTKKFTRRFVCHTRRFRFPGGANSSRGTRSTKGNPPASPLTK